LCCNYTAIVLVINLTLHYLRFAVGNFNFTDWGILGGLTAISYPLGYLAGGSPSPAFAKVSGNMGRPSAVMASIIGATAGFMLAYQNSSGRLMGFNPNDAEVRAAAARS